MNSSTPAALLCVLIGVPALLVLAPAAGAELGDIWLICGVEDGDNRSAGGAETIYRCTVHHSGLLPEDFSIDCSESEIELACPGSGSVAAQGHSDFAATFQRDPARSAGAHAELVVTVEWTEESQGLQSRSATWRDRVLVATAPVPSPGASDGHRRWWSGASDTVYTEPTWDPQVLFIECGQSSAHVGAFRIPRTELARSGTANVTATFTARIQPYELPQAKGWMSVNLEFENDDGDVIGQGGRQVHWSVDATGGEAHIEMWPVLVPTGYDLVVHPHVSCYEGGRINLVVGAGGDSSHVDLAWNDSALSPNVKVDARGHSSLVWSAQPTPGPWLQRVTIWSLCDAIVCDEQAFSVEGGASSVRLGAPVPGTTAYVVQFEGDDGSVVTLIPGLVVERGDDAPALHPALVALVMLLAAGASPRSRRRLEAPDELE